MFLRAAIVLAGLLTLSQNASSQALKPHKDRLFSYPDLIEQRDGGDYRIIDYQELRDINKRDKVPERRVNSKYVDYAGRRATKSASINTSAGNLTYHAVGTQKGARVITIYIHGKGGSGKQGINDFSFGGNFNRIKMLMLRNRGLYLSPDAGDFTASDVTKIRELITDRLADSPGAKLIVACGSGGGEVCYRLSADSEISERITGIALMGSFWNNKYPATSAGRGKVPVMIAHGSRDTIFAIGKMEAFYQSLRKAGIPTRMVRFETGTHGTPIRMMDWRETINWMIAQN